MTPKDLDKLIEKYLEGKCTQEEMDLVDSLYASVGKNPPFLSANTGEEPTSAAGERILRQIDEHVQKRQVGMNRTLRSGKWKKQQVEH